MPIVVFVLAIVTSAHFQRFTKACEIIALGLEGELVEVMSTGKISNRTAFLFRHQLERLVKGKYPLRKKCPQREL